MTRNNSESIEKWGTKRTERTESTGIVNCKRNAAFDRKEQKK